VIILAPKGHISGGYGGAELAGDLPRLRRQINVRWKVRR
jgi:hypothetical protein